jgi:hypothetical protein
MNRFFEAVAENEIVSGLCEALGITWRKVFQYLGLFCFLVIIYSTCLSSYLKFVLGAPPEVTFGGLMRPLLKFCLVSALPFGLLAYSDETWRSSDAAPVCLGAWVLVCYGFSLHCVICPVGVAFPFFPFILTALLAHTVGTLCQLAKPSNL